MYVIFKITNNILTSCGDLNLLLKTVLITNPLINEATPPAANNHPNFTAFVWKMVVASIE